jgi:uncharacterized OB-fold protein
MTIRSVITRLFPDSAPDVVVECRRCGTTVSPATDVCPECGATAFSRYEIPE